MVTVCAICTSTRSNCDCFDFVDRVAFAFVAVVGGSPGFSFSGRIAGVRFKLTWSPTFPVSIVVARFALALLFQCTFGLVVYNALIVLGMLQAVFGGNMVASGGCVPCEGDILVCHLLCCSPNLDVRARALERLVAAIAAPRVVPVVVPETSAGSAVSHNLPVFIGFMGFSFDARS